MDIISTLVQALALFTAITAIIANFLIHKKNRNVNTVIQLTKDFYQNNDFTRDRLKLWAKSTKLRKAETDFKFDYGQILESIQDNDETTKGLKNDEIIALNRTVAFYHTIRILIRRKEVDVDMLRDYFGYNYNNFWEPLRKRLEKDSDKSIDKDFLKEIPELKDRGELVVIFVILRLTQKRLYRLSLPLIRGVKLTNFNHYVFSVYYVYFISLLVRLRIVRSRIL